MAGSSAAAFEVLLESAEALAVQASGQSLLGLDAVNLICSRHVAPLLQRQALSGRTLEGWQAPLRTALPNLQSLSFPVSLPHPQVIAAKAAPLLAASAQLDWAPSEQARSTAYSPHIEELVMYLKASWCLGA